MKLTKLTLAFIASVLIFFSCQKSAGDKLTTVIPANAAYVVHVDVKSLAKKADYNIFENITVSRLINLGKAYVGKEETLKLLDAFTKDVNSLGIDVKGDSYFYTDYKTYGLVFGVNDVQKLKKSLLDFGIIKDGDIKEEKGIYTLPISRYAVISWNNDVLVVLGDMNTYSYYGVDESNPGLEETAKKLLTQDKSQSIASNPAFATFMNERKDISLFQSYANLDLLKMAGADLPEGIMNELKSLQGVSTLGFVSFETGEVKMSNKVCFDNSDTEKKYNELIAGLTGKLNGDQLKYMIENPIFMVSMGLKGAGIYNYLDKLGLASELEESISRNDPSLNAKSIFELFDGDMSFAVNTVNKVKKSYTYGNGEVYEYDSTEPNLVLLADVKDGRKLLDFILQVSPDGAFVETGENTYTFEDNGSKSHIGLVDNKTFYYTNDAAVVAKIKDPSGLKNNFADLAKGNVSILSGDLANLRSMIKEEVRDEKIQSIVLEGFDLLGSYEYTVSEDLSGKGKWVIKDNSKNSFAVICHYLDRALTRFNDEINNHLF